MKMRKKCTLWLGVAFVGLLALYVSAAQEPAQSEGKLIVVDEHGKEQKITGWRFSAGIRHLTWLASATDMPDPKAKNTPAPKQPGTKGGKGGTAPAPGKGLAAVGPEAFEFREENSTNWENGVVTLVPLDRARMLEYDPENEAAKMTVATGPKEDNVTVITGLTKFRMNQLTIEAEIDKGALGVAEVKFLGGVAKGGVAAVKFPPAKFEAKPSGRAVTLSTKADKSGKTTHRIGDLQPLYRVGDREVLSPHLYFKKTLKVDVAQISKITIPDTGDRTLWTIKLKDGGDETLSLLTATTLDGKAATLVGFVGRVRAGYKLFPLHLIGDVEFDITD